MQEDNRKIRLPQSYREAEKKKKQAEAAVQETYLTPDEASTGDAGGMNFAPELVQSAPAFLPEIPDSAVTTGAEQTLEIELPVRPRSARSGGRQTPPGAYDYKADAFVPQPTVPRHPRQADVPRSQSTPQRIPAGRESVQAGIGTPQRGGASNENPAVRQQTAAPQITRRTLPLAEDVFFGVNTGGVQPYGGGAQMQDAQAVQMRSQLRTEPASAESLPAQSVSHKDAALPAQAAYRPRHAAAQNKGASAQPSQPQSGVSQNKLQAASNSMPQAQKRGEPVPEAAPTPSAVVPKGKKPQKPKKKHRLLKKIIGLCVCLALLCCAGLAVYLNVATKNDFLWLDLAQLPHRDATVLFGADGAGDWLEYARLEATQQKIWVDIENVPQDLQHAFVAIEDQRFYKHNGVSVTRTLYAVLNEVKFFLTGTYFGGENGIKQGASTITQQLVKNLTYDNEAGGVEGYFRKLREIYRAYKLDADYEKDEILEAYLNVISFTGNTAGVQAESVKLFNKTVGDLTLEQCASVAAITKNPYRYDPMRNPETHLTRRNYILYEMWQQEYISEEQYNLASAQPIGLEPGVVDMAKTPTTSYFTDKLIEDVSGDLARAYGLSRAETTNLLHGRLQIHIHRCVNTQTTVIKQNMRNGAQFFPQPGIQSTVAERDEDGNAVLDEAGNPVTKVVTERPQAAMVSVGYDGALKAVVGGIGEKDISRGFNRGTAAVRQVGSTMKPIGAYALAVENNKVHWSTAVMDAPVRKVEDEATGEMREWPANFSKSYSNLPMLVADALAESINTVAVRVGERAGVRNIYNFARKQLGITSFVREDRAAGPMILGSSTYGVTPYELAGAHMMFGNGGLFTTLHSYTDVQTGYGRSIVKPKLETRQVLSADAAYVMNRLLKGVMEGAGTAAGYAVKGEMESIGKTGTTSDNRDYWFVGLTPYYVTATWYGYDSGAALNTSLGTHAPTTAWRTVMQQAQRGLEPLSFPVDETVRAEKYCTESGGLATASCPRTRTGYYRASYLPGNCIIHKA